MKSPPHQIHDDIAFNRVEAFIRGEDNETLVGHRGAGQEDRHAGWPAPRPRSRHRRASDRRPSDASRRRTGAEARARGSSSDRPSLGYRSCSWLLRDRCRPGRPGRCSGLGSQASYLALADEARLVEPELRARPGPAARRPAGPAAGPARVPRVRPLSRRADARARTCPRSEVLELDRADSTPRRLERHPRRLAGRRLII